VNKKLKHYLYFIVFFYNCIPNYMIFQSIICKGNSNNCALIEGTFYLLPNIYIANCIDVIHKNLIRLHVQFFAFIGKVQQSGSNVVVTTNLPHYHIFLIRASTKCLPIVSVWRVAAVDGNHTNLCSSGLQRIYIKFGYFNLTKNLTLMLSQEV
jgi:hypothetical protein